MKLSKSAVCVLTFVTCLVAGNAGATLNISQQPLILGGFVEPNVLFILDDSGSMHWETMPDELTSHFGTTTGTNSAIQLTFPMTEGVHGGNDYQARRVPRFQGNVAARFRSSHNNTVYYNPAITYQPWVRADGTLMPNAPPEAAWHNPVNPDLGTRNLTSNQWGRADWVNDNGEHTADSWNNFYPAVYYHYLGSGNVGLESNYERVEIIHPGPDYSGHGRENRTEDGCSNGICSSEAEMQNFANWYSYHRNRIFAARAGIGRAFSEQSERMRIGYGTINAHGESVDGVNNTQTVIHGVRRFDDAMREVFFEELYERPIPPQGTPLREALQGAGQYYQRADNLGPWSDTPGEAGGEDHLECRQSYTVLMTDGYWNQGDPDFTPVGNVDGNQGAPFADGWSNTLADVAMYYWMNDLRPDLDNLVPTTALNPADWQHMSTFGVGLGVQGALDIEPQDIFDAIRDGEEIAIEWPNPHDSDLAKIDDLLHAGVNSRGGFFSAMDANEFSRELSNVLKQILSRAGSTTAFSVSSSRIDTDSMVFQAEFSSDPWWGDIAAINPHTGDVVRRASDALPPWSSRNIFTSEDGSRVNFSTTGIADADLRARIAPEGEENNDVLIDAIIEYVAGNPVHEDSESDFSFRTRSDECGQNQSTHCLIGDIINSQLLFSGKRNEGWARLDANDGGNTYLEYVENKQNRPDILYAGANAGMLHAFNVEVGGTDNNPTVPLTEVFAYVPNAALDNLHELTDPDYGHRFFVDGQIAVGDVYIGSSWRTVLVGTLGAGGRAVFALDVTNINNPQVLWELQHDPEDPHLQHLGHTFGRPVITRRSNGDWVAVFGNGYESGTEAEPTRPSLFMVTLNSDPAITRIEVPSFNDEPISNGLSSPAIALDPTSRTYAARIYAGDLAGNIWRFDLESNTTSSLFRDADSSPITATPELSVHAAGGIMVYVGTGKLFEDDDNFIDSENEPIQRFFAIRDRGSNTVAPNELAETVIINEIDGERVVVTDSTNFESGWRLDLAFDDNNIGERVLHRAQVGFGTVLFSTFEPNSNFCVGGGLVRLYILDALSGGCGLDNSTTCTVEIPIGAPVAPPIAILPPAYDREARPPPGYAPGDSSETVPSLPDPEETALRGERSQWCGSVGYWDPVNGQFVPFATLCEGRQAWRDIP